MVDSTPEARLAALLERHGAGPLALAESCTGGLIAQRITARPGSSTYFDRGLIVYSNAAKTALLGVDPYMLEREGAVSRACAEALLDGLFALHGAGVAAAVTGIAGPNGGTSSKPVGTVWIAWGNDEERHSELLQLEGDRATVREASATAVLERLCALLEG